jgi:hypothetical protein
LKARAAFILTALVALWMRQARLERRLSHRQQVLEADTRRFAKQVNEAIEYGAESWNRWGDGLVQRIKEALR